MDKCITAKETAVTHLPTAPACYDDGLDSALLIGVGLFSMIKMGSFLMITALPFVPQVGPFSMIKWARFRLTKTAMQLLP